MFEEYLRDTAYFIGEGRKATHAGDVEAARRAYRVAVMLGGAAIETFVNYLASTFDAAGSKALGPYELALLLDKRFGQQDGIFKVHDQTSYSRLEDKLRFLITRFAVDLDLRSDPAWPQFMEFKRLRDSLVHSRDEEDERPVAEYDSACIRGIRANFTIMNRLSQGIFARPLRAQLHDLVDFAKA